MSLPKDPEKFRAWLEKQKPKVQKRWSNTDRLEKIWDACSHPQPKGSDSPLWKGDNLKYNSAHIIVSKIKPKPEECTRCGSTYGRLELANLDGNYNRDPDNYIWLCTKCHRKMDGHAYKKMKEETRHGLFFNQYYQALSPLFLDIETL